MQTAQHLIGLCLLILVPNTVHCEYHSIYTVYIHVHVVFFSVAIHTCTKSVSNKMHLSIQIRIKVIVYIHTGFAMHAQLKVFNNQPGKAHTFQKGRL